MSERRFAHANNPSIPCAESVILLPFGRHSYLKAAVEALEGEEIPLDETTDRIAYSVAAGDARLTLLYSGMGSPAAANALEMAAANGARQVVVFGACGGVSPEVAVGDLIAVSGAVRGEGTSPYYAPMEFPAAFDPRLVIRLFDAARRQGRVAVHRGAVYTTDAGYRQGPEIYEACRGLILGVESECAAVAVVGARLGLATGALLFCSDNVTLSTKEDRAYRGLANERVRRGFETGLAAVTEVLTG
jgi:uridine phosphorylase